MYLIEVKKIKTTLLVFFLLLFFGYSFSIIAIENSTDENIFLDSDQDDLGDQDELKYGTDPKNPDTDGDGYQDGSEVNSGYNPLISAPGDKIDNSKNTAATLDINPEAENLTTEFSNRIAEMVANGESTGGGVDMASINALIEEKISNNLSFSELPEIDDSSIKLLPQDYSGFGKEKQARKKKEDNEEYLSSVSYIMTNNLPHSVDSKDAVEDFSKEIMSKIPSIVSMSGGGGLSYFTDLADKGNAILIKLNDIEVPADMFAIHKKGLQLATYAISLKDKVKVDNNDPIASIVSFSEVENMMVLVSDYMSETESELRNLGLTNFVMDQALQIYE